MNYTESQKNVIEELIESYCDLSRKYDKLQELGISIEPDFLNTDKLLDWALDLIGFPPDTTLEKDKGDKEYFNREYLTEKFLLNVTAASNTHNTVKEYIDFLYKELENLKREAPQLFQ